MQRTLKVQQENEQPDYKMGLNKHLTKADVQMETKHMERCCSPHVIREMLIRTTTKYHCKPIRMATLQATTTLHVDENIEQQEVSYTVGGNAK